MIGMIIAGIVGIFLGAIAVLYCYPREEANKVGALLEPTAREYLETFIRVNKIKRYHQLTPMGRRVHSALQHTEKGTPTFSR